MKYLLLIATTLVLSSCIKDKLENESAVLIGNWSWDHSVKYTYDSANQVEVETILNAADYPDAYGVTFIKKGKVQTTRNALKLEEYRIILELFRFDTCDELVGGYEYKILLDNKADDTIVGCVKSDTLMMSDFHLPVSKGSDDYPYYKHYYTK